MNHINIKQRDEAELKFNKTKKGKIEIYLKELNIKAVNFKIPQELDGKKVIVERENGKVVKIIYGNQEFTSENAKPKKSNTQDKQQNKDNMGTAKAPYNFVPLNQTVVEVEQRPDFDKYHNDRYTGYIDIKIENLTPLYIRNSDKDEDKDKQKSYEFFNVDGKYIIPGSSIRGMIRTLVEIISYGKFGYFNDEIKRRRRKNVGKVSNHIPENHKHKDDKTIDIAEAIFGKESKFASRVFFEDAVLQNNPQDAFYEKTSPKILSSPKPTCFQHYLEQSSNDPRELNHWNSNAPIRGNKLYWHRNTPSNSNEKHSWNEGKIINDTQHTVIKPLKEKNKFKGRIRFENLSSVELGALLFAIDLPENCAHKLGMGKPLGLGSVKITIDEFFISDREKHYNQLFEDHNWYVPRKNGKTKDEFKNDFEKYVLEKITLTEKSNAETLWNTPRLKELKCLLNWQNTKIKDWNEKTRYMEIRHSKYGNEYRERPVLPKASDVVK